MFSNSKQTFVCGPRSYLFWGEHGAGGDFCGSWYQCESSSQSILCSALSNQFLCRRPEIIQCLRLHTFYRSKEKSERNLIEKYCYKLLLMRWDHQYPIGQLNYLSKHSKNSLILNKLETIFSWCELFFSSSKQQYKN